MARFFGGGRIAGSGGLTMGVLLTIAEAATLIGVPKASLRTAAERHGFLIRMGRAIRIDPDQLPELLRKCQNTPKAPASTGTNRVENGSSATLDAKKLQQAQQTVQKLRNSLRNTSQAATGAKKGREIRLPS
ncbi:hypothetical protein [Gemmobacter denitrificans]|uniref:Excisionase family DNA binding protein n=1 Tax=Gemmobacter denitrificans TaxID=3123040 RepID=A0ABU8BRE6_9RHOB